MTRRAIFSALIVAVAAGALAFRLPQLDRRPMHTDEANQAYKAGRLHDDGFYRYDPHEHHGPTLYYLTLPSFWLSGARSFAETTESSFRIVPVVLGVGLIPLLLLIGGGFGRPAALCAGVLAAISPAMVFYSRYYIQETLLVFFTFAAIAAGWRYTWTKKLRWALLAGACLGLMHATKETCVLAYAAMGLAVLGKLTWRRWWGYPINVRAVVKGRDLAAALAVAVVVSFVLFSSFFTNWRGPLDSVLTYGSYFRRSGGEGLHEHPWHYYLKMLLYTHEARGPWWSEGLIIILALVGFVAVMLRESVPEAQFPLVRFIAFYTLFLTAAYSILPYKTPWCLLGFLHGMILLAGVGAVVLVRIVPTVPLKALLCLLLAAASYQLAGQAHRGSFRFCVDRRNPYVYAHTSADLLNLVRQVEEFAQVAPRGREMVINVKAPDADHWPLPWYLRRFPHVGYPLPKKFEALASLIIIHEGLEEKPPDPYKFVGYHGLRPTVHLLVYARKDLWKSWQRLIEKRTQPAARPKS